MYVCAKTWILKSKERLGSSSSFHLRFILPMLPLSSPPSQSELFH